MTGATGRPVANSELAQVSSDGLVVTIGHDRWQEYWEVKLHKPRCARSVLGPCHNGRARASAVTNGRRGFRGTAGRWPSRSRSWDNADGRFGLWSRRAGVRVPSVTHFVPAAHCRVATGAWASATSLAVLGDIPLHDLEAVPAAACGGLPGAGNDTTGTGVPAYPLTVEPKQSH